MTIEEAKKIAKIINTADGYCEVCVENLYEKLQSEFPEIPWGFNKKDMCYVEEEK